MLDLIGKSLVFVIAAVAGLASLTQRTNYFGIQDTTVTATVSQPPFADPLSFGLLMILVAAVLIVVLLVRLYWKRP